MGATASEQVATTPADKAVAPDVVSIATDLESWSNNNHPTAKVMKYVRNKAKKVFGSKTLSKEVEQWIKYIRLYNEQYPGDAINPAEIIMKVYNDKKLVQYVNSLQKYTTTKITLQQEQWLESKMHPDEVFHEMGLDKPLFTLLADTGRIRNWVAKMEQFTIQYPNINVTIRDLFPYGDKQVIDMLYFSRQLVIVERSYNHQLLLEVIGKHLLRKNL
ncbi:unnamed protein product [Peronospora belbahrii]|uniref:Uncharacterized protein n=1 Tax=Peronospora belbahrii TaxID=622444 RepID=A0ABN8CTQ9_9STRA|nr:unnamed protein product [Peronospora belbahrii]